jgi:hypothetical protein
VTPEPCVLCFNSGLIRGRKEGRLDGWDAESQGQVGGGGQLPRSKSSVPLPPIDNCGLVLNIS